MSSAIEPFSLLSGIEKLGSTREGWTLDQTQGITADRHFRTKVKFDRPFRVPPVVHIGIVGFDISEQDAARLEASVEKITTGGFELVLSTWLNTQLWRVNVSWLAIGR